MGPRGAVQGPERLGSAALTFVSTSALAEKMALDFSHRSCPRAVQTQVCVPSACWMFFPNVPVLSLTPTRPHSLKTPASLSPLDVENKGTEGLGWFSCAGREKNEATAPKTPMSLQLETF